MLILWASPIFSVQRFNLFAKPIRENSGCGTAPVTRGLQARLAVRKRYIDICQCNRYI
jgi:hypothetical protein